MHASARTVVFIIIAVALVAVSGWRMAAHRAQTRAFAANNASTDPAAWGVQRYTPFLQYLKPEYGVVGFIARPASGDDNEARGRYQTAAYALVPIVLARSDDTQLLIVDFPSNDDVLAYAAAHGWRIVWGPRPGLALLERQGNIPQ